MHALHRRYGRARPPAEWHQEENSTLRAEVSRQANILKSTTNHLMMEAGRVYDAARLEAERLIPELAYCRGLIDQRRMQRSDA